MEFLFENVFKKIVTLRMIAGRCGFCGPGNVMELVMVVYIIELNT